MQLPLRIGARASQLSQTQTGWVRRKMAAALGVASEDIDAALPLVLITTTGDKIQDRRLLEAGGKQLFTKEIEEALLDGRVDLAVHSLKDVPAVQPEGLALGAIPEREDVRDAFLSLTADSLEALPKGARLGTASLRRQAQMLRARPDLDVQMLRGNVDTRLKRLAAGDFDAILLAASGLHRLGLAGHITAYLDPVAMPPAPGQGALAVQCRAADAGSPMLAAIHSLEAEIEILAERGALEALEGSCRTAIGAHARLTPDSLTLVVEALSGRGDQVWRRSAVLSAPTAQTARDLGLALGSDIGQSAGEALWAVSA